MNAIFQFVLRHGCLFLFGALFAHQLGFPLPGPLFLLAGGAMAAAGKTSMVGVIGLTILACVLADSVWYEAGRRGGEKVLHSIHRLTRDPDFHDRRAKAVFARYGLPILLIAKFVPGLDAVTPPLAAISHTSRLRFLAFDSAGAGLYACVYGGLGYIFSHDLDRAAGYVGRAGKVLSAVLLAGLLLYAAWRLVQRIRSAGKVAPIQPAKPIPVGHSSAQDQSCIPTNTFMINGMLTIGSSDALIIELAQQVQDENR